MKLADLTEYAKISERNFLERIIVHTFLGSTKNLAFPPHHAFYDAFNRKIEQLVAAGVIDHIRDTFDLPKPRPPKLTPETFKVMSLEHLKAGFVVWLVSLFFPSIAFMAEWIMTLKNFIIFKIIYANFIKTLIKNMRNRDRKLQKDLKKIREIKQNKMKEVDLNDATVQAEKELIKFFDEIDSINDDSETIEL